MDLLQLLKFFVIELQATFAVQEHLHFQVCEYQNDQSMFVQPANDSVNQQRAGGVLPHKK